MEALYTYLPFIQAFAPFGIFGFLSLFVFLFRGEIRTSWKVAIDSWRGHLTDKGVATNESNHYTDITKELQEVNENLRIIISNTAEVRAKQGLMESIMNKIMNEIARLQGMIR